MKRRSLWMGGFASALLLVSSVARAEWRDWWWTQEQRAQQALEAGQAARAAPLFSDPKRRAYAEIKAGQYAQAAERLASVGDPDAQYNRGNALARAGDLRGALAAYDAALARASKGSSTERDARRNRELVERQLEKQEQEKQEKQDQQQQQSGEEQPKADESRENAEQSQGGKPQSGQGQSGQNSPAEPSADQGAREHRDRGKDDAPTSPSQDAKSDAKEKEKDAAPTRPEDGSSEAADANEAQREQQQARATNQDKPPTSERALAVEQWLRQIPDDPGGLLRRKFLLEHRRKQREAQP